jgi:uncharacterized membrane protein (DUF2068 family)
MDFGAVGKGLLVMGVLLVLAGGGLWLLSKTGLPWGRLPGDIHIEGEQFSCFLPLATMIVVSVVLTLVLNILIRLINR